jgi:hypothetical protein
MTEPVVEVKKFNNDRITLMKVFHFDAGGPPKTMK